MSDGTRTLERRADNARRAVREAIHDAEMFGRVENGNLSSESPEWWAEKLDASEAKAEGAIDALAATVTALHEALQSTVAELRRAVDGTLDRAERATPVIEAAEAALKLASLTEDRTP